MQLRSHRDLPLRCVLRRRPAPLGEARVGSHRRDASASLRGWLVGADWIGVNASEWVRRGMEASTSG